MSGNFWGRLLNYGAANLLPAAIPASPPTDGLLHDSATPLDIASGQNLNLYGDGLTNEATMTLAGNLNATREYIGASGTAAVFTQTGGTNYADNELYLGYNAGASGAYTLSGGSLDVAEMYVGYDGSGAFTQTGGTASIYARVTLHLGY